MAIIFNGVQVAGDSTPAGFQSFTASGTWTCPTGVTRIFIHIAGGGGGGARGSYASQAGAGGSCWGFYTHLEVTAGTVYTVTVGAGGAIGTTSINSTACYGSSGGTSSFGALLSYPGAGGGQTYYSNGLTGKRAGSLGSANNGSNGTLVNGYPGAASYTSSVYNPSIYIGGGSIGRFNTYSVLAGISSGTAATPTVPGQGGCGRGSYNTTFGVPSPGFRGQIDISW